MRLRLRLAGTAGRYSCDFGLLFGVAFAALYYAKPNLADGFLLVAAAMVCSVIASYRMTIAFSRYLRVHRPLETVLVSQVIAVLFVFTCLVWIADFSRQV
jgi:ABC-type amino acid transport system permease subunit